MGAAHVSHVAHRWFTLKKENAVEYGVTTQYTTIQRTLNEQPSGISRDDASPWDMY